MQPVGNYALGVTWRDKHESIFPFANLRRACPCVECEALAKRPADPAPKLQGVGRIGDASLMLRWADGHETLFLLDELRDLCGCAACKGEPDYPVTGQ